MALPRKQIHSGGAYIVTASVTDGRELLADDWAAELLLATLVYFRHALDFRMFAFVIMPNHMHAIIQPSQEATISEIMMKIKGTFAHRYNRLAGTTGRFWESRFLDEILPDTDAIREKMFVIHENPVRHGLCRRAGDYRYSSYSYLFRATRFDILDLLKDGVRSINI